MSTPIAGAGSSHVTALRHDQATVQIVSDEKLRKMQFRTDAASTKGREETLEAVRALMAQNAALLQALNEKEEHHKASKSKSESTITALVARLEALTEAHAMTAKRTDDLATELAALKHAHAAHAHRYRVCGGHLHTETHQTGAPIN